jgi:hypothetical protein
METGRVSVPTNDLADIVDPVGESFPSAGKSIVVNAYDSAQPLAGKQSNMPNTVAQVIQCANILPSSLFCRVKDIVSMGAA